jgi:hypothetical protein
MYYNIDYYLTITSSGDISPPDEGGIYEIKETYISSSSWAEKINELYNTNGIIKVSAYPSSEVFFPPIIF